MIKVWEKLGLIYEPSSEHPLLFSHATNPLPVYLKDNIFRIFYSARNRDNKSSVSYIDFDIEKLQVIYIHPEPVFTFGDEKSFYSHGVSIGNCYTDGINNYILFMGWQQPANQHWFGEIGRLQLSENKFLKLNPEIPFLKLDSDDPISLSYPFVLFHENIYKMWYGSTIDWHSENGEMVHVIKFATSSDGVHWNKKGTAIPFQIGVAQAFSRPTVLFDEEGFHMWYSYRSGSGIPYRIGYAVSKDGLTWENKINEVGIDVSAAGWDSEMICYPFVFDFKGRRFMLYNGNGYGKNGFGLAAQKID